MGKSLFVTGTGTDVGKTYVTGLIVKSLREAGYAAGYYKAALSGADVDEDGRLLPGDLQHVVKVAGLAAAEADVSYIYRASISPHLAAKMEGNPLSMKKVGRDYQRTKEACDYLTVEGSGGIVCPLRWDEEKVLLEDVVRVLHLPVLLVADAGLGTINATVLSVEYMRAREMRIKGIFLNNWKGGRMEEDNANMIEEMTGVCILARIARGATALPLDVAALAALYE